MEPILKQIKNDLKTIVNEENLKLKYIKNQFQEALEYYDFYGLNRKKNYLVMRFVIQKREQALSFNYRYVITSKNNTIDENHSFADAEHEKLPGVTKTRQEKLKGLYEYQVLDSKIKNTVPIDQQYTIIMEVFKDSYQSIIQHVKTINKTKKIPE